MSGHSKWHSIKHKKGAADKARGKLFAVLIRQIEVAARQGGGDPESNATLRTMIGKARDNSVPMDTIQRAIKRGTGEEEGVTYESVNYEGYAQHGVAVFVQCLTDNRNRTGAEVMQRIAAPMVGGMITAPLLSMFVIPAAYFLLRRSRLRRAGHAPTYKTVEEGAVK